MKTLLLLCAAFLLLACKGGEDAPPETKTDVIVIETSMGVIKAKLYRRTAPKTVENFLSYVDKKHFDGTVFHRVMPNFMIQGGGFTLSNEVLTEKPTGDGIQNESAKTLPNKRGTLAMARTNDPHSATAQFFINVADNKSLDHPPNAGQFGYAVFGEVIEGMDVVDKIKAVETGEGFLNSRLPNGRLTTGGAQNVPLEPVIIKSIHLAP